MEQLSGIQEQLNQIVEGQQLNVFAEGGAAVGVGAAAAGIVVGLLICFFGLKLVKFLGALVGFFVGALIGAVIALVAGLDGLAFAGVVVAAGVILAVLSWFLYRIGVFFLVFLQVLGIASSILQPQSVVLTGVCAVAALVVAILAVIYVPLCSAVGFSLPATILLMSAAGALGDAGSPASDTTLGPTSGLNADGQHDHIWDTCVPTFIAYNIPLMIAGIVGAQFL